SPRNPALSYGRCTVYQVQRRFRPYCDLPTSPWHVLNARNMMPDGRLPSNAWPSRKLEFCQQWSMVRNLAPWGSVQHFGTTHGESTLIDSIQSQPWEGRRKSPWRGG